MKRRSYAGVQLILTDLGNVVIAADHAITHAYLVERGVPYSLAKQFFTIPAYKDFSRGRISGDGFYKAIQTLGIVLPLYQVIYAHNLHMFAIDDEVLDILEQASQHCPLDVATDTNEWQNVRVEEELLLGKWINSYPFIRSNQTGRIKSDQNTFKHYAKLLHTAPVFTLFIDDRADLCTKARRAGYQTIQFQSADQLRGDLMELGLLKR